MIKSNPLCTTIYYKGSFNPPHLGHQDALMAAMKVVSASKAIIYPFEMNSYKPDMVEQRHRVEMLKHLFKDDSRVTVCEGAKADVESNLRRDKVYLLIGSDVWPRFKKRIAEKASGYSGIIVSKRKGESVDERESVLTVTPKKNCYSSTKIRKHYDECEKVKHTCCDLPLDQETIVYIDKAGLYSPALRAVKAAAHSRIKEPIVIQPGNSGLSGDKVFIGYGRGGKKQLFLKAYCTPQAREMMENEVKGLKTLRKLQLKHVSAPGVLWQETKKIPILCEEIAEGRTMAEVWKSKDAAKTLPSFAFAIGKALRELHSHTANNTNICAVHNNLGRLPAKVKDEKKRKILESKLSAFLKNPGAMTYIHGDTNPGNFLKKEGSDVVTFVDLNEMGKHIDENKRPTGIPADDFYRFISSFSWFARTCHVDAKFISISEQSFREGYGERPFTKEADEFYRLYWQRG